MDYLEKNRGRRQYRPAPSAAKAVNRVLRPLSRKFGPGINGLQMHWPDIIGARWAVLSKPISLRGAKDGKTLTIEAKGPASAMIQAQTTQLLDKVNQYLGQGRVTRIVVRQGRIQPSGHPAHTSHISRKHVQETLATDAENSLQTALDKLGKLVNAPKNQ